MKCSFSLGQNAITCPVSSKKIIWWCHVNTQWVQVFPHLQSCRHHHRSFSLSPVKPNLCPQGHFTDRLATTVFFEVARMIWNYHVWRMSQVPDAPLLDGWMGRSRWAIPSAISHNLNLKVKVLGVGPLGHFWGVLPPFLPFFRFHLCQIELLFYRVPRIATAPVEKLRRRPREVLCFIISDSHLIHVKKQNTRGDPVVMTNGWYLGPRRLDQHFLYESLKYNRFAMIWSIVAYSCSKSGYVASQNVKVHCLTPAPLVKQENNTTFNVGFISHISRTCVSAKHPYARVQQAIIPHLKEGMQGFHMGPKTAIVVIYFLIKWPLVILTGSLLVIIAMPIILSCLVIWFPCDECSYTNKQNFSASYRGLDSKYVSCANF